MHGPEKCRCPMLTPSPIPAKSLQSKKTTRVVAYGGSSRVCYTTSANCDWPTYSSTMVLAVILLRKTWGLLLITCLGFVAAVMLACAVPLYSDVSMTAGLRGAF